ncbi:hypothetical protein N9I56_05055 [Alphaproteobacteria bacterium]|nr:hypothetical protein [Alphaproteobacteria bacterium]
MDARKTAGSKSKSTISDLLLSETARQTACQLAPQKRPNGFKTLPGFWWCRFGVAGLGVAGLGVASLVVASLVVASLGVAGLGVAGLVLPVLVLPVLLLPVLVLPVLGLLILSHRPAVAQKITPLHRRTTMPPTPKRRRRRSPH